MSQTTHSSSVQQADHICRWCGHAHEYDEDHCPEHSHACHQDPAGHAHVHEHHHVHSMHDHDDHEEHGHCCGHEHGHHHQVHHLHNDTHEHGHHHEHSGDCCHSGHSHDEDEGETEHVGCQHCQNVLAASEYDQKGKFSPEQKREATRLGSCLFVFALLMIFENSIASRWGEGFSRLLFAFPYAICGFTVFREAWENLRKGSLLNEFTLMCVATIAAVILGHMSEAVGVMLFYCVGEFLQGLATSSSRGSIRALLASKPTQAKILQDGRITEAAVEDVQPGAIVLVGAGDKIPLDGVVISGTSQVDQSPLTGESAPVSVSDGSEVNGGCINLSGSLEIRVTRPFSDSHMARILDMVEHAATRKSPTERFISRFARYYTPAVVAAATMVAVLPPLFIPNAEWSAWIYRALVLLVISCPCALIISIPLGYFGGIGAASRKGILVKGGNVLDGLLKTNTVVFDKTGTLTQGNFAVAAAVPADGVSEDELLEAAALAENASNHPVAQAVMRLLPDFIRPAGLKSSELPGQGMQAELEGDIYLAGKSSLLSANGIKCDHVEMVGSIVHVAKNSTYFGYIVVRDTIKADSAEAIAQLKSLGLKTAILSGDRENVVASVAAELGVDTYRAELMPEDKVRIMEELAPAENLTFVGDGVNDAPGLALARVGVAMGRIGSEAAVEAADAVIINDSPTKVAQLFKISSKVHSIVWQNIVLALGVKITFMGLGIVGLSGLWEAVFADVGVALLAVLNATRAMRVK